MDANNTEKKKPWETPKLIIHGDVEKITAEGAISQKEYGDGDGVIANARNVKWIS